MSIVLYRLDKQHKRPYNFCMGQAYRRKETCVFLINYHVVFCPKRRRKILVGPIRDRLMQIVRETAPDLECDVLALGGHARSRPRLPVGDSAVGTEPTGRTHQGQECPVAPARVPRVATDAFGMDPKLLRLTAGNVSSETIARYIAEQTTRD